MKAKSFTFRPQPDVAKLYNRAKRAFAPDVPMSIVLNEMLRTGAENIKANIKAKVADQPPSVDDEVTTTYRIELRSKRKRGKKWEWDGGTWDDVIGAAQSAVQYEGHGTKARLVEVFSTERIVFRKERNEILAKWRKGGKK